MGYTLRGARRVARGLLRGTVTDVRLDRVWLTDVRSYESAELELAPGLTALLGDNGQGKTNVLEAIGWLATLASFRGAPTEALIRQGAERAVIRAEGEREGRADPASRPSWWRPGATGCW